MCASALWAEVEHLKSEVRSLREAQLHAHERSDGFSSELSLLRDLLQRFDIPRRIEAIAALDQQGRALSGRQEESMRELSGLREAVVRLNGSVASSPDFLAAVALAVDCEHRPREDGWIYCAGDSLGGKQVNLYVNGFRFHVAGTGAPPNNIHACAFVPVRRGDVIKCEKGYTWAHLAFFPARTRD